MSGRKGLATGFGAGVGFVGAVVVVIVGLPFLLMILACGGCFTLGVIGQAQRVDGVASSESPEAKPAEKKQSFRPRKPAPRITVAAVDGFNDFQVRIEPPEDHVPHYTGIVKFKSLPGRHETVSKVVREVIRQLIAHDPNESHLVMAFDSEGMAIGDFRYCGALEYKPGDTEPRRNQSEAREFQRSNYAVVIDSPQPTPLNPDSGYTMFFGFPAQPSDGDILRAVRYEIQQRPDQTKDVISFIYVGDPSRRLHWEQMPTGDGNYRGLEYDPAMDKLTANWFLSTTEKEALATAPPMSPMSSPGSPTSPTAPLDVPEFEFPASEQTPSADDEPVHRRTRTWRLVDGREIEGKLTRIVNRRIVIEQSDGTKLDIQRDELSEEDRQFLDQIPRR